MTPLDQNIEAAAQIIIELCATARQWQAEQRSVSTVSPAQLALLKQLQLKRRVTPPWPLGWPGWPPGLWSKLVAAIQRGMLRLMAWWVLPMLQQQNEFNQATVNAFQGLMCEMLEMRVTHHNERLQFQIRLDDLLAQNDALRRQLTEKGS